MAIFIVTTFKVSSNLTAIVFIEGDKVIHLMIGIIIEVLLID